MQLTKEQLEKLNEDPDMLVSITDEDVFPLRHAINFIMIFLVNIQVGFY